MSSTIGSLGDAEIVVTDSGVPAMRDRDTGEVMHPIVGPLVEVEAVYIAPSRLRERLVEATDSPLVVFDVGLGAGTNAVLAFRESESRRFGSATGRKLEIVSFERALDSFDLARRPEHATAFGFDDHAVHAAEVLRERGVFESPHTTWRLIHDDILEALERCERGRADITFWDPYSPKANAHMWTIGAFALMRRCASESATLHTYSGSTKVRSALLLAGFAVGTGDRASLDHKTLEPKSKIDFTTIAAANHEDLKNPLDQRWLERLSRSTLPFPSDLRCTSEEAFAAIRSMPQFGVISRFGDRASRGDRS